LFSRPIPTDEGAGRDQVGVDDGGGDGDKGTLLDQQWSIEERLQELNNSLPSGFKTSEERMAEINKGLNKLGLSLYTQKEPFARFHDAVVPKSDDEQVEEIMAQAKDEVELERHLGSVAASATARPSDSYEDGDDDDDDDDDADQPGDELLEDDQLAIKKIRNRVIRAQIKLVELVALLDEAKAAKDGQYKEEKEASVANHDDDDDSNDDDDDDSAVSNLLTRGKKRLRSAQLDLRKAMRHWEEDLMV
jgi:hypothetical protein